MPRIAVIINHQAGSTGEIGTTQIEDALRAAGFESSVTLASDGSKIVDAAKQALSEGADIVVAGGGDGTVSAVASELVGSGIALGVLPLGTLNHFAKDIGIPMEPDQALQTIVAGHRMAVDVAEVNGKFFLNNSSIGIYPDIVKYRETQQRRFGKSKWTAFFWACMNAMRRHPFLDVQLKADGENLTRHTPFVFVGNNEYSIDGFDIGERKTLSAGTLSLYVSQRTGRIGLLGFAVRALFGRLRQARDFDAVLSEEVVIRTRIERMRVSTDGEVAMMETPLNYRIRAGALTVLVPAIAESPPA